jgi:hypothetical protein
LSEWRIGFHQCASRGCVRSTRVRDAMRPKKYPSLTGFLPTSGPPLELSRRRRRSKRSSGSNKGTAEAQRLPSICSAVGDCAVRHDGPEGAENAGALHARMGSVNGLIRTSGSQEIVAVCTSEQTLLMEARNMPYHARKHRTRQRRDGAPRYVAEPGEHRTHHVGFSCRPVHSPDGVSGAHRLDRVRNFPSGAFRI